MDIQNMSNRQLEALIADCEVELRERQLITYYEDALTHHVYIDEAEEQFRSGYHEYLVQRVETSPAASEIIEQYYCDEDYKQSMRGDH